VAESQVLNANAKDGACGAILPIQRIPASPFALDVFYEEDPSDPYSECLDRGHRSMSPMIAVTDGILD
jgi:hypothetical protein